MFKDPIKAMLVAVLVVFCSVVFAVQSLWKHFPKRFELRTIVLEEQSTININLPITDNFIDELNVEIIAKDKLLPPEAPLYLFINSPGGLVEAGLRFIDVVTALKRKVHTISLGSYSMAFIISQMFNDRYLTPYGIMFSHSVSGGFSGQMPGSLESRFNFDRKRYDEVHKKVADRAGMSLGEYRDKILRELWLGSNDAIQSGFADEVVLVKCGSSMKGTTKRTVYAWGAKIDVEFAKCPLIVSPVKVSPMFKSSHLHDLTRDALISELLKKLANSPNRFYYNPYSVTGQ
jgi:ATP-dependent protease ClpP protease subunit